MSTSSAVASADQPGGLGNQAAEWLALLAKTSAARVCPKGKERDKLLDECSSLRELLARVFASVPRIRLYLGLFQVKDEFIERAPLPTPAASVEQAESALENAHAFARQLALQKLSPPEVQELARQSIVDFACQFSGKLIHSQAQGASSMVPNKASVLPHLSARRLQQSGWRLPLDQNAQDNTGLFGRVVEILRDDPVVPEAGLEEAYVQAVQAAYEQALGDLKGRTPRFVDAKLRQLLLPAGEDLAGLGRYLAVSPLGAGGLTQAIAQSSRLLEKASAEQAKAAPQIAPARKPDDTPATAPRIRFSRLEMPGGNPQNITTLAQGLKEPLYFETPQASSTAQGAWKLLRQPMRLRLPREVTLGYARRVLAFGGNPFGASASLAARHVERAFLYPVVRQAHDSVLDAAQIVQDALYEGLIEASTLSEEGVRALRSGAAGLNALDRAAFFGEFSQRYVQEMASQLQQLLRRACDEVLAQALRAGTSEDSSQRRAVSPLSSASLSRQARALHDLLEEVI